MPPRPLDDSFLPQLQCYRASSVYVAFLYVGFGEQGIEEHVRMLAAMRKWIAQRSDAPRTFIGKLGITSGLTWDLMRCWLWLCWLTSLS